MINSVITGIVATFDRDNIDTDQIIPTEYLKSIKKYGFGDFLLDGWRYLDEGKLNMTADDRLKNDDFILNQEPFNKSNILLTRDNFGCGSSREHAVWALRDFGFKAVIASSFGDIFYNNCFKNSVLPIVLTKEEINNLIEAIDNDSKLYNDTFNKNPSNSDISKNISNNTKVQECQANAPLDEVIFGIVVSSCYASENPSAVPKTNVHETFLYVCSHVFAKETRPRKRTLHRKVPPVCGCA